MMIKEKEKTDTGTMSLSKQEGMGPRERWRGRAPLTSRSPRETGGKAEVAASCRKVWGCGWDSLLKFSLDFFCCLTRLWREG